MISFVCTTYRRFRCVERVIAQYHQQTYGDHELIIFNTDEEYPLSLGFTDPRIHIINNGIDYKRNLPYRNRGEICRDAVTHCTGDYFMLADDDDIYLPWHMEQAWDGIQRTGKDAWKPERSMFCETGFKISLARNTMEASVIVRMRRIREIGFRSDLTGYEGLSWYTQLRDEGQLREDEKEYVPSYCFNWGDPWELSGHKQSGDINNPKNFENHKAASTDFAKRALRAEVTDVYRPYFEYLSRNRKEFSSSAWDRYALNFC